MQDKSREIINQAHAARIRGVSRSRISELVKRGRFTTPVDEEGNEIKGALYRDEVVNYKEGKRGRPRAEKSDWFTIGTRVIWTHEPRGGFGFTIEIPATVVKTSSKKILLEFTGGDRLPYQAWVIRDVCRKVPHASDNEFYGLAYTLE